MDKVCKKCSVKQHENNFQIRNHTTGNRRGVCINCIKQHCHNRYLSTIDKVTATSKAYYIKNKEAVSERHKQYRVNNKEKERIRKKNYYINNKESILKRTKEHRAAKPTVIREYHQRYYLNNKQQIIKKTTEYKKANPTIAKGIARRYSQRHPDVIRYRQSLRRARIQQATFKKYLKEIKKLYENCPKGCHVDHIIPLNHPDVCGLHVPWNLQYLLAEDNIKKSNKLQNILTPESRG